jgi:hypothetical protein
VRVWQDETMTLAWETVARVQFEGDAHVIEDACGFAGPTAWMIDGATSLLEPLGLPAASDPQWLAQVLNLELGRFDQSGGAHDGGARAALASALYAVDVRATELVGPELVRFPSAAISVARLNDDGVELAALADCTVVVETDDGGIHMVQAELADARVDLAASRSAVDPDERRRLLIRDRELRNTPGNLWVARREAVAADHAHVVQLGRPTRMVMATDGAWRAVDLGLVSGPEEFLDRTRSTLGALELMTELRRKQAAIGEVSDDATVMTLEPRR